MLKPKSFVLLPVQGIIDKIKHFVRLVDSGPYIAALVPVLYIALCVMKQTFLMNVMDISSTDCELLFLCDKEILELWRYY